jgi:serine/threonine protein kinase
LVLGGPDNTIVKICDFGMAKRDDMTKPDTCVGTMAYIAPEVAQSGTGAGYDGKAADIWSLGVMLFVLALGDFPFGYEGRGAVPETNTAGMTRLEVGAAILSCRYVVQAGGRLSAELCATVGTNLAQIAIFLCAATAYVVVAVPD